MNRKTIWINKTNLDRFDKERNKSGLVNALLEEHYELGKIEYTAGAKFLDHKPVSERMAEMKPEDVPKVWQMEPRDFNRFQKNKGKK